MNAPNLTRCLVAAATALMLPVAVGRGDDAAPAPATTPAAGVEPAPASADPGDLYGEPEIPEPWRAYRRPRSFLAAPVPAAETQPLPRTRRPLGYHINYTDRYITEPDYADFSEGAPPEVLHIGKSVPITHHWGPVPVMLGENQYAGAGGRLDREMVRLLSPAELADKIDLIRAGVRRLHAAGVETVIPYIGAKTIAGDHETGEGFWNFYAHWDDYAEWLGPRPPESPTDWLLRNRAGNMVPGIGGFSPGYYAPLHRYQVCLANPYWIGFSRRIVRLIAECGYDGVFVDNAHSPGDNCTHCRVRYRRWLAARYTPARLGEWFGTDDLSRVDLYTPGLPESERRKYVSSMIADYLLWVGDAGREVNADFRVFPNRGHYDTAVPVGQSCELYMFENTFLSGARFTSRAPPERAVRIVVPPGDAGDGDDDKTRRRHFRYEQFDLRTHVELAATLDYPARCDAGEACELALRVEQVGMSAGDDDRAEAFALVLVEVESGREQRVAFAPAGAVGGGDAASPPRELTARWKPDAPGEYALTLEFVYTDPGHLDAADRRKVVRRLRRDPHYPNHIGPLMASGYARARAVLLHQRGLYRERTHMETLGLAEVAAFGRGAMIQAWRKPRENFVRLLRRWGRLWDGLEPYGDVGVLLAWWGPNPGRMQLAAEPTIVDHIAAGHRLMVPLMDRKLTGAALAGRSAVYAVSPRYEMSDAQLAALRGWIAGGGVLVIGEPGATINGTAIDEALGAAIDENGRAALGDGGLVAWDWNRPRISGRAISPTPGRLAGVRFAAYAEPGTNPGDPPARIVLHAVNYNVSLVDEPDELITFSPLPVALPIPDGWSVDQIIAVDPDATPRLIEHRREGGALRFDIRRMGVYKIVEIRFEPAGDAQPKPSSSRSSSDMPK